MLKILFLSSNFAETHPNLIKEYNIIKKKLEISKEEIFIKLEERPYISIEWIKEEIHKYEPHILHFSGRHGARNGLIFKNEITGVMEEVSLSVLDRLFSTLSEKIDLVFLNACYSEKQARVIAEHVNCVINVPDEISDIAAIEFASTFYNTLQFGKSIEDAFNLGIIQLGAISMPEEEEPKLIVKKGIDSSKIIVKSTASLGDYKYEDVEITTALGPDVLRVKPIKGWKRGKAFETPISKPTTKKTTTPVKKTTTPVKKPTTKKTTTPVKKTTTPVKKPTTKKTTTPVKKPTTKKTFSDWWNSVPADLKENARKGDENNKPLLNQVNFVLAHLRLAGKHDAKPSHEELKDWLHSGQVDVLRPTISETSISELKLERYPYARFPEKVVIDDIIPLEVIIKSTRPSYSSTNFTSINLKVDDESQKEIPVQVIVECEDDGFVIEGKYYAIINVPIYSEDSNRIFFNIKPKKEGEHSIQIIFLQQNTVVGELKIKSLVKSTKKQVPISTVDYKKEWKPDYPTLENPIPGEDFTTLYIHEINSLQYDVVVFDSGVVYEMDSIKFQFNPATKFQKIFENIENLSYNTEIIDKKIKAQGMSLYDELFPEKLKELYWELRDTIKSIRVISKEPWIPWEIIKPWRQLENGNFEEDDFLCERYAFSRWLVGKKDKETKNEVKRIKVIMPIDINVNDAVIQRNWIEVFALKKNIDITYDSSFNEVTKTLETEKAIDILHFIGHGQNNPDNPNFSELELESKVPLNPQDIKGKIFGQSRPMVILNACQTGNQGFSLTGIQGWAPEFLNAGASVFIGTLWAVNTKTALNFIQEFYTQLSSGVTLGESVKNARNKSKKEGDTSWLAYQLYGHPNSKIKF